MRQWMIDPKTLCNRHLLGEHVEHHMFVGTINKGISYQGYLVNKLLNPRELHFRHAELVLEMLRRGINHKSELPDLKFETPDVKTIDIRSNLKDLHSRCKKCKQLYLLYLHNGEDNEI
jgi:hypothetical protein